MSVPRSWFIFVRLGLTAFALLTSAYCLLAYIPFTYHQVHLGGLLPWFSTFARIHPYLYWAVLAAVISTLPNLRIDGSRTLTALFVFVHAMFGVRLILYPVLTALQNDGRSLLWCVAAMVPLVWVAAIDWLSTRKEVVWAEADNTETTRAFHACTCSAMYLAAISVLLFLARHGFGTTVGLEQKAFLMAVAWSVVAHAAAFCTVFLILNFTSAAAHLISRNRNVSAAVTVSVVTIAAATVLKSIVFAPLSFTGPLSFAVVVAVAFSIVSSLFASSLRLLVPDKCPIEGPLMLMAGPFALLRNASRATCAGVLFTISCLACFCVLRASTADWGYLVQTLITILLWCAVLAAFYVALPARSNDRHDITVIGSGAFLSVYIVVVALLAGGLGKAGPSGHQAAAVFDDYANYDISFRAAYNLISPATVLASNGSIYAHLAANTNISRSVRTDPVDVNLVAKLSASTAKKPNIFIFVIDSLRRDYMSPYNSAVTFTPAIEAFARESVAVPNAFTHYSGTGLSEPSIWAGSMLLHKQYVTPFAPMDALEKMLQVDGYRQLVTKDEILKSILSPTDPISELDSGRATMNCELCQTLAELESKLEATRNESQPIFVYTQPQNIHVSVIARQGRSAPADEEYPGFDAAYASRIRKMDRCFGEFVEFLKRKGMFDNSVVILTSDHGDSLGEAGKWGHAYNVTPEVIRVPLLFHLPQYDRALKFDGTAPVFLTDITPSLYYLAGHRPIQRHELYGKPLFTETTEEARQYRRSSYLIASSYAPVYGLLSGDAQSFYVVDGVNYRDYAYHLGGTDKASVLTAKERATAQQFMRGYIDRIGAYYGFHSSDSQSR